MNLSDLNDVLKAHGLEAEMQKDGSVVLTEKALQALADCQEPEERYYLIKCRHEVDITYRVPGTSFENALEQLSGVFDEHGRGLFGPQDYHLHNIGGEVVDTDCYTDPSPTGRAWTRRDWEYETEDEDSDEFDEDMAS